MKTYPLYLAGKFVDSQNYLSVINPFSQEPIGQISLANEEILNTAIQKAHDALAKTRQLSSYQKFQILSQIASEIEKRKEELAQTIALESAKPYKYAGLRRF